MIGDTIRKYRKANHMSQDDLAEKLNVTRQSISLWENNQTQPSLDSIVALAKLFNVSTDTLLTESETDGQEADDLPLSYETPTPPTKKFPLIPVLIAAAIVVIAVVLVLVLRGGGATSPKTPASPANADPVATSKTAAATDAARPTATASLAPTRQGDTAVTTKRAAGNGDNTTTPAKKPTTPATPKATQKPTTKPPAAKNFYADLKAFVMKNGEVSGDTVYFIRSSDLYGGSASENFDLFYYSDSGKISFCLYCPVDADHVLNIYVDVPSSGTAYPYLVSYCYQSGESITNAEGTIPAGEFTTNYPLPCSYYYGDNASRPTFLETSRQGVCDLLSCVKNFLKAEGLGYSLSDIGFKKF